MNKEKKYNKYSARQEREIGHTCLKGIYLDELDPSAGKIEDEVMEECSIMCQLASSW